MTRGDVVFDPSVDERWHAVFEARAGLHASLRSVVAPCLDADVARALRRSLATFQLGETGDGEHLLDAARRSMVGGNYVRALSCFVAEEQEHARMLAVVLEALNGPLLSSHWSDRIFVLVRRAHSLVTEVLVLLVAEVVALAYYSTLRDCVGLEGLRDVFTRIHCDETVHVDFHCDTLPRHLERFSPPIQSVVRVTWSILVAGAATSVALSHGAVLRATGTTRRDFVRAVLRHRDDVAQRLFDPDRGASERRLGDA